MIYEISNDTLDAKKYFIEATSHSEALSKYSKEKAKEKFTSGANIVHAFYELEKILIKPIGELIK